MLAEPVKVLVNHVGYEAGGGKRFVVLGHQGDDVKSFLVIDELTGKEAGGGAMEKVGAVDHWKDWIFWNGDLTSVKASGIYRIECVTGGGSVRSWPFEIREHLLEQKTLSNVIYYFKGQRCSGLLDRADRNLKFEGSEKTADVHGGWFDATGDYGKHLSHLSFSTYFNPQQIPMTEWSLLKSLEEFEAAR